MCVECVETKTWRGHWHAYRVGCDTCAARAIARSLAAFKAIRKEEPGELRDMIGRVLPNVPFEDARSMVWEAWQVDHEHEEAVA